MTRNGNQKHKTAAKPLFVLRAERAMRRAARHVRAEYRRLGLKPAVFKRTPLPLKSKA